LKTSNRIYLLYIPLSVSIYTHTNTCMRILQPVCYRSASDMTWFWDADKGATDPLQDFINKLIKTQIREWSVKSASDFKFLNFEITFWDERHFSWSPHQWKHAK
jgi:hypothetical protein